MGNSWGTVSTTEAWAPSPESLRWSEAECPHLERFKLSPRSGCTTELKNPYSAQEVPLEWMNQRLLSISSNPHTQPPVRYKIITNNSPFHRWGRWGSGGRRMTESCSGVQSPRSVPCSKRSPQRQGQGRSSGMKLGSILAFPSWAGSSPCRHMGKQAPWGTWRQKHTQIKLEPQCPLWRLGIYL